MRQGVITCIAVIAAFMIVGASHAAATEKPEDYWASEQIAKVVDAGVMGPSVAEFRPDDALTWDELAIAVGAIRGRAPIVRDPAREVTLAQLDAWLVRTAKLGAAARRFRRALTSVGFSPPRRVATETVARLAGFRINHEQPDEALEILPSETVSRAEAAYSFARMLEFTRWERRAIKRQTRKLALPQPSEWQREVLNRGLAVVGHPYVWAGTSPDRQELFGQEVSGGFDCSGFTWHVYKGQAFVGAEQLGSQLIGRTSYAMSGEFDSAQRLSFDELQPADVLFFGDSGIDSEPAEVRHMGIYLGDGWMVHSSRHGTTVAPISGWYQKRFAWGRRVLAEAGLS